MAKSLSAISSPFVREPAPFVTRCRRRTVANRDSTTLRCGDASQCPAVKSKNVSGWRLRVRFRAASGEAFVKRDRSRPVKLAEVPVSGRDPIMI
jgi:hypothetical protein